YLAICYAECVTRPVRVYPAGCGCDQLDCEYSRIRDSFQLKLLWSLPESHTAAKAWDTNWANMLKASHDATGRVGLPVPPCPECTDDCSVVLATITIPTSQANAAGTKAGKTPI